MRMRVATAVFCLLAAGAGRAAIAGNLQANDSATSGPLAPHLAHPMGEAVPIEWQPSPEIALRLLAEFGMEMPRLENDAKTNMLVFFWPGASRLLRQRILHRIDELDRAETQFLLNWIAFQSDRKLSRLQLESLRTDLTTLSVSNWQTPTSWQGSLQRIAGSNAIIFLDGHGFKASVQNRGTPPRFAWLNPWRFFSRSKATSPAGRVIQIEGQVQTTGDGRMATGKLLAWMRLKTDVDFYRHEDVVIRFGQPIVLGPLFADRAPVFFVIFLSVVDDPSATSSPWVSKSIPCPE